MANSKKTNAKQRFDDSFDQPNQSPHQNASQSAGQQLEGEALIKETCRRIRAAKGLWDAHRNAACRGERDRALELYNQLAKAQKDQIPQQLRIWLRYRSEKYFGAHQTAPGSAHRSSKGSGKKSASSQTASKSEAQSKQKNQPKRTGKKRVLKGQSIPIPRTDRESIW